MKKNRLYFILSLISITFFFITAATCSFCGLQISDQPSETSVNETIDYTDSGDANTAEASDATETGAFSTTAHENAGENENASIQEESQNEAPGIKLSIIAGPLYSDTMDICYYQVEAAVTGVPEPVVTFSKDDSEGNLGRNKCQVNLTRDTPDYMLTATASNPSGEASDFLELNWVEPETPESESTITAVQIERKEITLEADPTVSGYIFYMGDVMVGDYCTIGDSEENKQIKGYLSFNIGGHANIEVIDVQLRLWLFNIHEEPASISEMLNIRYCDYGNSLDPSDFSANGVDIKTFNIRNAQIGDYLRITGNDMLKKTLNQALKDGKRYYQLQFRLMDDTNHDGGLDFIDFRTQYSLLRITYTEQ